MLVVRFGIYLAKKETEKNADFTKNLLPFMIYCVMFMRKRIKKKIGPTDRTDFKLTV